MDHTRGSFWSAGCKPIQNKAIVKDGVSIINHNVVVNLDLDRFILDICEHRKRKAVENTG